MSGGPPDPAARYPIEAAPSLVFLRNVVRDPRIEIGEYSYYDDPEKADAFERENVLYLFDDIEARLRIGRFCALARGVRFLMDGGNHALGGFSTYPFNIFGGAWKAAYEDPPLYRDKGDIEVGHDVWIGREALVLAGTRIGHGAIVGANAVVAGEVPPYAVAVGNPARVVRRRFPEATIAALLEIAWWDWPVEKVTRHIPAIVGADLERLRRAGREDG